MQVRLRSSVGLALIHPRLKTEFGPVAKLVDALDLGSSGYPRESSSLSGPTIKKTLL